MVIKTAICSDCGIERVLGSMTDGVCILCREGETTRKKNRSSNTESKVGRSQRDSIPHLHISHSKRSSANAIDTVNKANTFFALVSGVLGILLLLVILFSDVYPIWMLLPIMLLNVLIWLLWASGRMVIGMAQDIRAGASELEAIRRALETRSSL